MDESSWSDVVAGEVRAQMARAGKSGGALADAMGMGRSAFSRRYRGETAWALDEIEAIASLLGVPLRVLLHLQPDEALARAEPPPAAGKSLDVTEARRVLSALGRKNAEAVELAGQLRAELDRL